VKIEEIFTELEECVIRFRRKAISARKTALKARKNGDLKKSEKFSSVARVHESVSLEIGALVGELLEHTPNEFQDHRIPF